MPRKTKQDKEFEKREAKGQCDILILAELKEMYQRQKARNLDRWERDWILKVRNEKREEGHQDRWYEDFKVNPKKIEELRKMSLEEIKKKAAEAHNEQRTTTD